MRLLVLNGPNLDLLGQREPQLYGTRTLVEIEAALERTAQAQEIELRCQQSNHEGDLIERVHQAAGDEIDGLIVNAGGYTHTSVALRDALLAVGLPFVEVHLSNLARREPFRQRSLLADIAIGSIGGFGPLGYELALIALAQHLKRDA